MKWKCGCSLSRNGFKAIMLGYVNARGNLKASCLYYFFSLTFFFGKEILAGEYIWVKLNARRSLNEMDSYLKVRISFGSLALLVWKSHPSPPMLSLTWRAGLCFTKCQFQQLLRYCTIVKTTNPPHV